MSTQEKMFAVIEQWQNSGKTKKEFLVGKNIREHRFNYWILKWKRIQQQGNGGFEPISLRDPGSAKVMEIVTVGGLKITVFT